MRAARYLRANTADKVLENSGALHSFQLGDFYPARRDRAQRVRDVARRPLPRVIPRLPRFFSIFPPLFVFLSCFLFFVRHRSPPPPSIISCSFSFCRNANALFSRARSADELCNSRAATFRHGLFTREGRIASNGIGARRRCDSLFALRNPGLAFSRSCYSVAFG